MNGSLDVDSKLIAAYHAILLCALRALDNLLHDGSIIQTVTVVTQSEAILQDPSNYWILVINAGRHFSLTRSWVVDEGFGRRGEGYRSIDDDC